MSILIYFLTGVIFSAIIAWLLYRNHSKQQFLTLNQLQLQQQASIAELQNEKKFLQSGKDILLTQVAKAESKNEYLEHQLANQKKEVTELGERFQFEFKHLAQNILEEKSEKFTQVNEAKIKAILEPLRSEIGLFKLKVEETYDKESKERFSLGKEVERLILMTQQVSAEANNLTSALKGNNKMQGNWGEMILERLLENSGLTKDRDYFLQEFIRDNAGSLIKDEFGKGLQPDVTIYYPDHRKIIIDSKVSLLAWDECMAQDDKEEQRRCLLEHIKSIRLHIDGLSKKNYPKYAVALDYVLLFIPIEPAFLEALKEDPRLWKYAYDKKILLVSATNLFAVLKIIADLWKVEQQNRNAIDIADKAGLLYDKFVSFTENLEIVGKKINEAGSSFDTAFKQLSTGRGNLVSKVEELKKMGANASKQLPDRIILSNE